MGFFSGLLGGVLPKLWNGVKSIFGGGDDNGIDVGDIIGALGKAGISTGANLIGGAVDQKMVREENDRAYARSVKDYARMRADGRVDELRARGYYLKDTARDRRQQLLDRSRERKFFVEDRNNDRAHAAKLLARDKMYYKDLLTDERRYARNVTVDDREYARALTASDRAYAEKMRKQDRKQFIRDQNLAQRQYNAGALRTAQTRGIDFEKLRDDAVKAGFNPLTAMSMAHAYSTEVDYTNKRGTFNDGAYHVGSGARAAATTTASGGAGGPMGSGGGMAGPGVMSLGAPSGGFQSPGAGYSAPAAPVLSSGGFVAEAMSRGVDTWFNAISDASDREAYERAQEQAVMEQVRQSLAQTPRDFGYSLTRIAPYRPAVGVSRPVFNASGTSPSDDLTTPSQVPLRTPWGGFEPSGEWSDASAFEERYGDFGGSVYGASAAIDDFRRQALSWLEQTPAISKTRGALRWLVNTGRYPMHPRMYPAGTQYMGKGR